MTTNVPVPTFGPLGFIAPLESAILVGVQADMQAAFGGNLNFTTTTGSLTNATPQGQLAASQAAIIGNANDTFLYYTTQTDPAYAEGRMQDAIGRIYFMERNPALPTTLQVTIVGDGGVIIPLGSLIVDPNENLYTIASAIVIPTTGSVNATFVAQVPGLIPVPTSVAIYQAIAGWDTVGLISGVQGQNTETRAAFEARRASSTAVNSVGSLPSILGAVQAVPGVFGAYVYENPTAFPVSVGSMILVANSVYVAAIGGTAQNVATAIWTRKGPGCAYNGNTTVTIFDESPGYVPPFPSYNVTFEIPSPLPLLFAVDMVATGNPQLPSNATTLIQNAIITAGAGNPNAQNVIDGPAVAIGAKVWASRFIPSIAALGTWAAGNIISINIGSNNDPDAALAFGSCGGTSMTLSSLVFGTFTIGMTLSSGSAVSGTSIILPGTTIVAQVSGSVGGGGVYTISQPNFFTTQLVGGATADQAYVQVAINQFPTISAANIAVTYT